MTLEELQDQLIAEQDKNKALVAQNEKLTNQNKELSDYNTKLLDQNNKLFMRVTSQEEDKPQEKELSENEQFEKDVFAELEKIKK